MTALHLPPHLRPRRPLAARLTAGMSSTGGLLVAHALFLTLAGALALGGSWTIALAESVYRMLPG